MYRFIRVLNYCLYNGHFACSSSILEKISLLFNVTRAEPCIVLLFCLIMRNRGLVSKDGLNVQFLYVLSFYL